MPTPISTKPASSSRHRRRARGERGQRAAGRRGHEAGRQHRPAPVPVHRPPGHHRGQPDDVRKIAGPSPSRPRLAGDQHERQRRDGGGQLQHHRVDGVVVARRSVFRRIVRCQVGARTKPRTGRRMIEERCPTKASAEIDGRRPHARGVEPGRRCSSRAGRDQARPGPLLPGGRGAADARARRPAGADGALPGRRRRVVVLPEAGAQERARLAADHDRADAQRHAVAGAGRGRRRPPALGGQPGLPRLARVAVPGRRPRPRRRAAHRPRPLARRRRSRWCGRRPPRRGRCSTSSASSGHPKTTGRNGIHVYVRLRARARTRIAVRAAAVALARELERRRPDLITAAWWKEERGDARVRRLQPERARTRRCSGPGACGRGPAAQVSTPFRWDELDEHRARRADHRHRARAGGRARRSVGGDARTAAVARAAARAAPSATWPPA